MRKTIGDLVLLLAVFVQAYSQCCLSFRGGSCVQCPPGMHLYRSNCLFDIPNCIEYQEGFDCLLCKQGYTLTNRDCLHPRLNLEHQQVGPFTPYLHSAIKPDTMYQSAQHMVRTDLQLWVSWYNHSSIQNRTFLSSSTLLKKASQLKRRVMDSTLHYICTSTHSLNGSLLHLYRLTYQVSNPYGFADLLLAIEPEGQGVGYLEIVKVTISQLGGGDWYLLDERITVTIGQVLGLYFTQIKEEALMNGFWQQVGEGYNMTLFYLDGSRGVLAYSYQAAKEDLGSEVPTVDNSPEIKQGNNLGNNRSSITDNDKDTAGSQSEAVNKQSASNATKQTTSPTYGNASATTGNDSESVVQSMVPVEEMVSNPIYNTGYAVAIQSGYVDSQAQVEGLSYFPYNNSYGMYFLPPQSYSKLVFYIDLSIQEFRVAFFLKSNTSLLPSSATNISTNSHGGSTSSESSSSGSSNKTVPSNSSNKNNSPSNDTSNSNSSIPTPGNNSDTSASNSSIKGSATTVDLNSTLIDCPQLSLFQNVSLQGQFQSDLFLPKINLLLLTLYPSSLSNCQLSKASYSWRVGESALVSTIHYDLQYDCTDGGLSFGAEITNNELKIVSTPEGIQEGRTASNAANSTAESAANNSSPSTAQTESKSDGGSSSQPAIVVTPVIVTNNSKPTNNKVPPSTSTSPNSSLPTNDSPSSQPANAHFVIIDNTRPSSFFDSLVTNSDSSSNTSSNNSNSRAGTSLNKTSNFNNTSSDNKSQPIASNSSTNNDPVGTSTDVNNATTSNDSDSRTTVNPQNYKKDPQIRTLLQIIRDTQPIPRNATVYNIEKWTGAQQTDNYQVVFQVALKQSLNGSNFKMLTVKVKVLPGSLRQLQISEPVVEYQYRPTTSNILTSTGTLHSSTVVGGQSYTVEGQAGVSPLLGDGQFRHLQVSRLEQILVEHSPYLRSSISSSVSSSQLSTSFEGLKIEYMQLLRFQSAQYLVCFRVNYSLMRDEVEAGDERLQLQEYQICDCESRASKQVGLDAIIFRDVGDINVNSSILRRLQAITKGNTTILSYQEHKNLYRVRFVSSSNQKYQVIIDDSKGLIISYRHTPTTTYHNIINSHSPQKKSKDSPPPSNDYKLLKGYNHGPQDIWLRDLQDAIGRGGQFRGSTRVLKVEQTQSDSRNILLLQVILAQHQLLDWGILLNNYYRLSILEAVSPPSITILNITPLNTIEKNPQLVLSYRGLENSHQIPLGRLVATPQLDSIISQVKRTYPTFLMGCQVLLCLVNTLAEEENYFNTSYSEPVNLRIAVSKKYTSNYYASYLVTIDYRPQAGSVVVTGVQALSNNAILVTNCLTTVYHQGVPLCQQCRLGYHLSEGACYGSIEGCQQMYKGVCLECIRGQKEGSCAGEEVGKGVYEYIMVAGG